MNKVLPILAKKQPTLWRQAIRQGKIRGRYGINLLFAPIFAHYFSFKHHQSALFDHLIIGSNPVISALILKELHRLSLKIDRVQPVNIGLILTDDEDYWGYHALEKTENWQNLSFNKKVINFQSFLATQPFLFQDKTQHNLTLIESNFSLMNCLYDDYIDGYVLHLKDKESRPTFHTQRLPTVVHSENILRKQFAFELAQYFTELDKQGCAIQQMRFPEEKTSCKDNSTPTHLLLAKRVWLSSYPEGWLNIKSIDSHHLVKAEHDYEETVYQHNLSAYAFASARHCANDFHSLEAQTLTDMRELCLSPELLVKEKYHE